jgi:hypothetical protein
MQGFLDEQFTQLQQLQDDSNPDFVTEVVVLFFEDSEKLLHNLANALYVNHYAVYSTIFSGFCVLDFLIVNCDDNPNYSCRPKSETSLQFYCSSFKIRLTILGFPGNS